MQFKFCGTLTWPLLSRLLSPQINGEDQKLRNLTLTLGMVSALSQLFGPTKTSCNRLTAKN